MTDLAGIRLALAAALEPIGDDVQVSPYLLSAPTPPTLQILPGQGTYDQAYKRGVDVRTMIVQGFVAFNESDESQKLLDEMIAPTGPRSVKTLLETSGLAAHVKTDSGYAMQFHPSGIWMLLCEWTVEVWTQN